MPEQRVRVRAVQRGRFPEQHCRHVDAVHANARQIPARHADERGDAWEHVDERDGRVGVEGVDWHVAGPPNDEWDSNAALALFMLASDKWTGVAEEEAPLQRVRICTDRRGAMVRCQDGYGVAGQPKRVQRAQQPSDRVVEAVHLGEVLSQPVLRVVEHRGARR